MENIFTHQLIAVNIYTTMLDNVDNQQIIDDIDQHGHPPKLDTIPQHGIDSHSYHEDTVIPQTQAIHQLEQQIIHAVNEVTKTSNKIDAIWALHLNQHQSVMAHTHKSNQHINHDEYWSIAYYPEAPEHPADLIFHTTHNNTIDNTHRITPKPGLLIIFPSYILHYTDRQQQPQRRTVISANLHPTKPTTTNNADWTPYKKRPIIVNQELADKYKEQQRKGWRYG